MIFELKYTYCIAAIVSLY